MRSVPDTREAVESFFFSFFKVRSWTRGGGSKKSVYGRTFLMDDP